MKNLLSAIISVIVFSSAGFAVDNSSDNFTIPHDFSSGETISSQKMNENFQALQQKLNETQELLNETQELLNKLIYINYLTRDAETKYIVVGDGGVILISPDGTTWVSRSSGTTGSLYGVTYGNGTFVTVGWDGTILTSSDGTTWTSRTSGTSNSLRDVIYGNGTFVTVGESGTLLTSSDGTTWTSRTSGITRTLWGVTYSQ